MVPVIETWIWNVASKLDIKISDFIISVSTFTELREVTKKVKRKSDPRFKALFKEILKQSAEQNFLPVLKMKRIIEFILKENYNLDKKQVEKWLTNKNNYSK